MYRPPRSLAFAAPVALVAITTLNMLAACAPSSSPVADGATLRTLPTDRLRRAFSARSYWNTPLQEDAPSDPRSDAIMAYIASDATYGYLRLAGTGGQGKWGMPIYEARPEDPTFAVTSDCEQQVPPEFAHLRIPAHAQPDPTSDGAMVVYDTQRGVVAGLWRARHEGTTWRSCGGAIAYLNSNGLDGSLPEADEPRNQGHRGVPPPVWAVRWDEVVIDRQIPHVLKIAVDTTRCEHRFPMTGDECGTWQDDAPPEGTHIRIKPEVDLDALGLDPEARVIAEALQRFGAVIGDQSSGAVTLKVENTVAAGKRPGWQGLLRPDSLESIPLQDYEVIAPLETSTGP